MNLPTVGLSLPKPRAVSSTVAVAPVTAATAADLFGRGARWRILIRRACRIHHPRLRAAGRGSGAADLPPMLMSPLFVRDHPRTDAHNLRTVLLPDEITVTKESFTSPKRLAALFRRD
jgi:hypothetical protein